MYRLPPLPFFYYTPQEEDQHLNDKAGNQSGNIATYLYKEHEMSAYTLAIA
jgi:hypothetical protein